MLVLIEFEGQPLNGDVPLTRSRIRAVQAPSELCRSPPLRPPPQTTLARALSSKARERCADGRAMFTIVASHVVMSCVTAMTAGASHRRSNGCGVWGQPPGCWSFRSHRCPSGQAAVSCATVREMVSMSVGCHGRPRAMSTTWFAPRAFRARQRSTRCSADSSGSSAVVTVRSMSS